MSQQTQALPFIDGLYAKLVEGGVDELLAKHIAHLFIRDPLQVFRERIEQNDLSRRIGRF